MTSMTILDGQMWDNKNAPAGATNALRGLTRSLDSTKEGLAMKATRTFARNRSVSQHPHPDLVEAVTVSRFWRMVDVREDADCWLWTGSTSHGYGEFFYGGRMRPAHEFALSFTTGEARLDGLDTCHACDVPLCCNPGHLRFDTRQSNVDDMHNRGRAAVGEQRPNAKLTAADVLQIRERRASGARQVDLASQYGVSNGYISEIVNGLVWRHVGGPITGNAKRTTKSKRRAA